jgi:hypothetical protein
LSIKILTTNVKVRAIKKSTLNSRPAERNIGVV